MIHTCNRCGFSGSERDFTEDVEVSPVLKERVWNELAPVLTMGSMPGSEKYEAAVAPMRVDRPRSVAVCIARRSSVGYVQRVGVVRLQNQLAIGDVRRIRRRARDGRREAIAAERAAALREAVLCVSAVTAERHSVAESFGFLHEVRRQKDRLATRTPRARSQFSFLNNKKTS